MSQVQRAKRIAEDMERWIEGVIKDGEKYITIPQKLCDEIQNLIAEIQNQISPWEKEEHKWENVLPMLTKIEEYGATKFLTEHSIKLVTDECQFFVLKKTIMWRVLTFKSVISDAKTSMYELQDLQCSLVNNNKVVNPDHDWQLGICGLNTQDAIKDFRLYMEKIKAKGNFTSEDITQVDRIESMTFVGNDQLPKHIEKMVKHRWNKEAAKEKLNAMKNPNQSIIQELATAHDAQESEGEDDDGKEA